MIGRFLNKSRQTGQWMWQATQEQLNQDWQRFLTWLCAHRLEGDALLDQVRWLKVVEECVDLYEELARLQPNFDEARREVAGHVQERLTEILERNGVEIIAGQAAYDPRRHQRAAKAPPVATQAMVEIVSPGFAVGRRVLRRAHVQLVAVEPSPEA